MREKLPFLWLLYTFDTIRTSVFTANIQILFWETTAALSIQKSQETIEDAIRSQSKCASVSFSKNYQ